MNEKSPLEDLVTEPVAQELPTKADVEQEALSSLAKELKDKDLYFGGEKWEFGEIFSDGRILIRRPDASLDEPADTRERMLTAEEFKAGIEVVPRTP